MAERMSDRIQISIRLDPQVLRYLDRQSEKLNLPRTRLIENCVLVAVDDMKLLEKLWLLDAAKIVRSIQQKMKEELKAATL